LFTYGTGILGSFAGQADFRVHGLASVLVWERDLCNRCDGHKVPTTLVSVFLSAGLGGLHHWSGWSAARNEDVPEQHEGFAYSFCVCFLHGQLLLCLSLALCPQGHESGVRESLPATPGVGKCLQKISI